jgi:hypothetical protein
MSQGVVFIIFDIDYGLTSYVKTSVVCSFLVCQTLPIIVKGLFENCTLE